MASAVTSIIDHAHAAASAVLSVAEVKPGSDIPTNVSVKEDDPTKPITFSGPLITGKNVFVFVPGAFTGTCSAQVPKYIEAFEDFKKKGVSNIYVVGVNDVFVMKAWKAQLAPSGTPVHFIADDKGAFVGALGLLFDASELLGAPRSKRTVIVTEEGKVVSVHVEPNPGEVTITAADKVLAIV